MFFDYQDMKHLVAHTATLNLCLICFGKANLLVTEDLLCSRKDFKRLKLNYLNIWTQIDVFRFGYIKINQTYLEL